MSIFPTVGVCLKLTLNLVSKMEKSLYGKNAKIRHVVMPMGYIIFVSYESDAERKRIDYLLDKWSSRAEIKKPRGMVFFIETDNSQEFLEELLSKLEGNAEEKVEVYRVEGVVKKVEAKKRALQYTINEERKVVERFVEYLLSKLNASYAYSDAIARVYNVYTRKGRGVVKVILRGDGRTTVVLEIEGYGDVVDFLAEKIDEELRLFAGG